MTGENGEDIDWGEEFEAFLEEYLPRWSIVTQDPVDQAKVIETFNQPGIRENYIEWTESEDDEATIEEALAYLTHGMMWVAEEEAKTENEGDLGDFFELVFKQLLRKHFEGFSEDEIQSIVPALEALEAMTDDQLIAAIDYYLDNYTTQRHLTIAQQAQYLGSEMLGSELDFEIKDAESAREAIGVYRKCMEICDAASPYVLGVKRIAEGVDPSDADLQSMPFGAVLNQLEDSEFEAALVGIDRPVRNAIAHGDIQINPVEDTIQLVSDDITYDYDEFAEMTKLAVLSARLIGTFELPLMWISAERGLLFEAHWDR